MSSVSPRRQRIRRFSKIVALICAAMTFLVPLSAFIYALYAPVDTLLQAGGLSPDAAESAEAARLVFAIVLLVTTLPLSYGLLRLGACFNGFADDALFAASTIAGLRDFAAIILFWALVQPFLTALFSVLLTWSAPDGQHKLTFRFGSEDVFLGLFALCVLVVSWVLTEASVLSEENEQFI